MARNRQTFVLPHVVKGMVRFFDTAIVILCGIAVHMIYVYPNSGTSAEYMALMLITPALGPLVFSWFRCYKDSRIYTVRPHFACVVMAWATLACILVVIAFSLKISSVYSRIWAMSWFVSSASLLILSRVALAAVMRRWFAEGYLSQHSVIFGAGEIGQRLLRHVKQHPDLGLRIIGFADERKQRVPDIVENYPVFKSMGDLVCLVRQGTVDQVLVALPWSAEHRIREVVNQLSLLPIDVRLAPDLAGISFAGHTVTRISNLHTVNLVDKPISGWAYLQKSVEDRVLSSLLLILSLPLLIIIAAAIKLETPGPILFRQKRYGYNNQLIEVLKFRTMHHHMRDPNCDLQTVKNDSRVTRIGRFLRKTSLDELPQLINVLRGEMSIVGPRPHAVNTKAAGQLFEEVAADYVARHRVKPGITGWAQVNGLRGQTDTIEKIRKRVEYDVHYINNWSIGFDLLILLRTLFLIFKGSQAY